MLFKNFALGRPWGEWCNVWWQWLWVAWWFVPLSMPLLVHMGIAFGCDDLGWVWGHQVPCFIAIIYSVSISMFPVSNKYILTTPKTICLLPATLLMHGVYLRRWTCHNAKLGNWTGKGLYHFSPRWSSTKGVIILRWLTIIYTWLNKSG